MTERLRTIFRKELIFFSQLTSRETEAQTAAWNVPDGHLMNPADEKDHESSKGWFIFSLLLLALCLLSNVNYRKWGCSVVNWTQSGKVLIKSLFLFSDKPLVESWYNKHEADRNTIVWGESRGTKKVFSVYRQTRSHTPGLGSRQNVSLPDPLYSTVRFIFFSATYWSSIGWT